MFYCEACRKERDWPEGFSRSYGPCEICGTPALCYDIPSRALPIRKGKERGRLGERMNWANDTKIHAAIREGEARMREHPPAMPPMPQSVTSVVDVLRQASVRSRTYVTVSWLVVDKNGDPV